MMADLVLGWVVLGVERLSRLFLGMQVGDAPAPSQSLLGGVRDLLVQEVTTAPFIVGGLGILAASAFGAVLASKIGETLLPPPKESRLADFMPFQRLKEDGCTIECRDGSLAQVLRVAGVDVAFVTAAKRSALLETRKRMVDSLAELGVEVRVITQRERMILDQRVTHSNPLLSEIAGRWAESLRRVYRNRHYMVLSIEPSKNAAKDLQSAVQSVFAIMAEYGPELLKETPDSHPQDSPIHIFAQLASPVSKPMPKAGNAEGEDLNGLMTADYVHFTRDEGIIRFNAGDEDTFSMVMGIRAAGDYMDEQLVADLLTLDCEMTVLHNIVPIAKTQATLLLMQQRRMALLTTFSKSVYDQYTEALEVIENSDEDFQTLCSYGLTIIARSRDKDDMPLIEAEIDRICRLYGVTPVREGFVAQASFFSQFPTYDKYPRLYRLLSRAIACSMAIERAPAGLSKSDWGDGPISYFRTVSGTAYRFQFHVTDEADAVAHQVVIGPTGQGKTTLMSFLAGQAMRHEDLRCYFFDRHRGVEIFTNAIGGAYVTFDGAEGSAQMNPFDCEGSPDNRAFLRRWLKAITMVDDAQAEKEIARAVTTAFEYLEPQERLLENLHKSCFSPTGVMRKELFRWVNRQQYGEIFNATKDTLDLSAKFTAFDFTTIFEDETLAPAVISYIMHRIQAMTGATGRPSLIIIDETAPMLKHPMFRDYFIAGLQEGRKKRQAYVCAFQQPNVVDKLGMGEVIRGQCQTIVFFRNPQATEEDYESWRLTAREMGFIQGKYYRDLKYGVLIARPSIGESVIVDCDLSALGPYLKIYSSGRKNVLLAEQLRQQHGEQFVQKYLDVA